MSSNESRALQQSKATPPPYGSLLADTVATTVMMSILSFAITPMQLIDKSYEGHLDALLSLIGPPAFFALQLLLFLGAIILLLVGPAPRSHVAKLIARLGDGTLRNGSGGLLFIGPAAMGIMLGAAAHGMELQPILVGALAAFWVASVACGIGALYVVDKSQAFPPKARLAFAAVLLASLVFLILAYDSRSPADRTEAAATSHAVTSGTGRPPA